MGNMEKWISLSGIWALHHNTCLPQLCQTWKVLWPRAFFSSISTKVCELVCYFQQTLFARSIYIHTQLRSCTLVSLQFWWIFRYVSSSTALIMALTTIFHVWSIVGSSVRHSMTLFRTYSEIEIIEKQTKKKPKNHDLPRKLS